MVISRRQVEQSGIGSVLRELKPLLATREDTWLYRGPMPLVVDGYNEDPHELVDILQVRAFRRDVLQFIADALQTFKKLGPEKRKAIALEIVLLGRSGLDINDPADEYTLKSLPCVRPPRRETRLHFASHKQSSGLLVYGLSLISGFCSSSRDFALESRSTPPRGDALVLWLTFGSTCLVPGLSPGWIRAMHGTHVEAKRRLACEPSALNDQLCGLSHLQVRANCEEPR